MIVITAPTGAIGRRVLEHVVAGGQRVRVVARHPEKIPDAIRRRIEVVRGSHGDAATLDQALPGATALFWLPPPNFRAASLDAAYVDFTRPAARAIRQQGVTHVVSISALGRGTSVADKAGFVTASLAMDDLLASTGAHFRALTMPSFMDNVARQVEPIRTQGVFFGQIDGDRKLPLCATADIAATAAGLLLDPSWAGQGHRAVLGPENLSQHDMARIMSEVLGIPIRYQQLPFELSEAGFVRAGMSVAMAKGRIDMMWAKNRGLDEGEARTAENTTPTTFRQWCEAELKPAVLAG